MPCEVLKSMLSKLKEVARVGCDITAGSSNDVFHLSSSWFSKRATFTKYSIALLFVACGWVLTRLLREVSTSAPNSLFFCAIVLTAWRCGLGPAVFASILCSIAVMFDLSTPTPVANPAGEIVRVGVFLVAGIFVSYVTAKVKRREGELRKAQNKGELKVEDLTEMLGVLTENANDFIRIHDLDGRTVYSSPSVERELACSPATIFKPGRPDEFERARQWWRRVVAGSNDRLQWRVCDRDGGWHWLESVGSRFNFQGQPRILTVCRDVTDRHRAEETLNGYKEVLEKIFNNVPTMICYFDKEGRAVLVNRELERTLGWTVEEINDSGGGCYERLFPDSSERQRVRDFIRVASGKWEDFQLTTKDGRVIDVSWASLRLSDGSTINIKNDITERKVAEKALRESEAKLREAESIGKIGYWEYNLATKLFTWSSETSRILGVSSSEGTHTEEELKQRIHPADRERRDAAFRKAIEEGNRYDIECRIVTPTGEERIIHVIDAIERDKRSRPARIFGTVQDITERKQAEVKLAESHQLLQLVLSTLPVGVLVTDREGNIMLANEAAKRIWGGDVITGGRERWERSKGFWHDSGKRVGPEEWPSARAITHGHTSLNELIDIETFDGGKKIIQNSVVPIVGSEGAIVGALIVNEDVTEEKRAEEKLREAQAELARISRLTMLGELTATIAHEVNQPLAAVVTNGNAAARWLLAAPPNLGEAREAINRIVRDGTRASEVIQRIRAMFRRQTPAQASVDLNELVHETVTLYQPEISRHDILFQTDLAANLPMIKGDHVQLQQVLLNLLMNAVEALKEVPQGSRLLQVRTGLIQPDLIEVTVCDTGIGIQDAGRLFEPFYSTKPDGLGLGLSVSRSIVESHGGQLSTKANSPSGAVFQFTLPIQNGDCR
jgi:PAS domain S-box-containing protein